MLCGYNCCCVLCFFDVAIAPLPSLFGIRNSFVSFCRSYVNIYTNRTLHHIFHGSFCFFSIVLLVSTHFIFFCFSILVDVLINAPHLHILQIWKITWFFFVFNKTSFSFRFFYSSYEFQNETS